MPRAVEGDHNTGLTLAVRPSTASFHSIGGTSADHDARNTRIRCRQGRHRPRLRIGRSRPWSRSGNENLACDVSVTLPEGDLAGEEGIVRRRLHVAVGVEGP